jgi:hypothetical protein
VKKIFTLLLLLILTSLLFSIPTKLTRPGNPQLYHKLNRLAKANLKLLPASHAKDIKNC